MHCCACVEGKQLMSKRVHVQVEKDNTFPVLFVLIQTDEMIVSSLKKKGISMCMCISINVSHVELSFFQ